MNDFFLSQFKTEAGSPVQFRFSKFGSVVSDQDFIDPNHPEQGYLAALATEKFSDLVNHIPLDAGDGMNIVLSADTIDTAYFYRLLSPANPHFPDGADDGAKDSIVAAFGAIKAQAQKIWTSLTLESISGLMLQFKPSTATPANWYDSTKDDVWTHHTFQVSEPVAVPASGPPPQLWKLKLSDEFLGKVIQANEALAPDRPAAAPQPTVSPALREVRVMPDMMTTRSFSTLASQPTRRVSATPAMGAAPLAARNVNVVAWNSIGADALSPAPNLALRKSYIKQYHALDVSNRLLISQFVQTNQPTQPVKTNSISISFNYCLVEIRRPWYMDAFVNDRSWCIPGVAKGGLSLGGTPGNLPMLSVGFVAIRNLAIEANWSADDVANAAVATDFGPFKISGDVVNNKLSHSGLQIIGWIIQTMPALPPNDAPVSA